MCPRHRTTRLQSCCPSLPQPGASVSRVCLLQAPRSGETCSFCGGLAVSSRPTRAGAGAGTSVLPAAGSGSLVWRGHAGPPTLHRGHWAAASPRLPCAWACPPPPAPAPTPRVRTQRWDCRLVGHSCLSEEWGLPVHLKFPFLACPPHPACHSREWLVFSQEGTGTRAVVPRGVATDSCVLTASSAWCSTPILSRSAFDGFGETELTFLGAHNSLAAHAPRPQCSSRSPRPH